MNVGFLTKVEKSNAIFAKIKATVARAVIFPKINWAIIPINARPPKKTNFLSVSTQSTYCLNSI